MKTKPFSPLLTAANNIVKTKRPLSKRAKDYDAFVNWLGVSNKDIKKIKLPKVKKVENLEFSVGSALGGGGGGGGGLFGSLLAVLGIRKGAKFLKGKFGLPKGKFKGSYNDIIKNLTKKGNLTKGEKFVLRDYKRLVGKGGISNNSAAFRALNRNSYMNNYGKGVRGGGFSAETAAQFRQAGRSGGGGFKGAPRAIATGTDDAAKIATMKGGTKAATKNIATGGKVAKAFGKFGASIIPGIGAVVGAADATLRAQSGDTTGAYIAGAGAGLDAFAAAAAATGIGLPLAGLASILSFGLDVTNLIRDLSGASDKEKSKEKPKNKIETRLKEQERTQRETASASNVTFVSITDKFDKVVSKFEKFARGMGAVSMDRVSKNSEQESYKNEGTEGGNNQPPPPPGPGQTYDGPVSGDSFYPLPGGSLSTRANGYYRGEYGTDRDYPGGHSGQDIGGLGPGSPVVAWKTGKITYTGSVESGDTVLTIDHGNGVQSRYKHVVPSVSDGSVVYGGQQIATLFNAKAYPPHLHFEVWKNGSHVNPNPEINKSQKIPAPLSIRDAKNKNDKSSSTAGAPDQKINTIEKQQPIEDFIKGTKDGDKILKDPKLKAQLLGQKTYPSSSGFEGLEQTPEQIDPKVKQYKEMYNSYVRDLREKNQKKIDTIKSNVDAALRGDYSKIGGVVSAPTQLIPAAVAAAPLQTQTPGTVVLMGNMQPQVAARPSIVPVPIPMGGGQSSGGGTAILPGPSEGAILNSLWKTMLLTNLSAA